MAKTDRDRLIKTFMQRNRRKGKGPLDQGFPKNPGGASTFKPGKASATTDTNLYRLGADRKLPPGLRHYLSERHSVPAAQQVLHDGTPTPAGTGPFRRPRRGRTRPTPGSYYGRKTPTSN